MCSLCPKLALLATLLFSYGCERAATGGSHATAKGEYPQGNQQGQINPGNTRSTKPVANRFEETDEVIGEGKLLYNQFNCSGCHAGGGGAIGPALMDDEWTYGSSASNIFWTIIEGRPQGMPAFGGKIAEEQAWKIAAYVRSLSGIQKTKDEQAKR